jgi:colicin import membrane protein
MRRFSSTALLCLCVAFAAPVIADELKEAEALLRQGKAEAALGRVEARLKTRPQEMQARFLQGVILSEIDRAEEAKKVFRQLTVEFPEAAEPHNNLAVLYAADGEFGKARDALEMAVRANPRYGTAHENLGDVYGQLAAQSYGRAAALGTSAELQQKLKLARELGAAADTRPTNSRTP